MAVALGITIFVAACNERVIPTFEEVELHRSSKQSLIVTNFGSEVIYLQPANRDESKIPIFPDAQKTIYFIVITRTSQDDSGNNIAGSEKNYVERIGDTQYLSMVGDDWMLIASPEGDVWEHEIDIGECWFVSPAGPSSHLFDVSSQPDLGVPVEICP